jgi:protocatechuate 3,4-dioxygenase beta subunit
MKLLFSLLLCVWATAQPACQKNQQSGKLSDKPLAKAERHLGGPCECCEAWQDGMPDDVSPFSQISPSDEVGEALEISGTIYQQDGKTPASNIILYVYHTNAQGLYSDGPDFSECAKRHGHLRGWMKTGTDGQYRFKTIRPASYPNTAFEQHIHPIIKEPGLSAYWIDEFVFDDDSNLTEKYRQNMQQRGGNGIVRLHKNADGAWLGNRDIILGKNVPGY